VRLGRLDDLVSLSQGAQWLNQPAARADGARPGPASPAARPATLVSPPEAVKKKLTAAPDPMLPLALTAESLPAVWERVLARLGAGFLVNSLQKADLPAISAPNTLVLRFPPGYNHEREYCSEPTRV